MKRHSRFLPLRWRLTVLALASLGVNAQAQAQAQAQTSNSGDTTVAQMVRNDPSTSGNPPAGSSTYSLLPYTRSGYVGLNVGRPRLNVPCGTGYSCDDPNASVYLYTGGLINETVGAELGYINIGSADRSGGSTRSQGVKVSLVLRAPMGAFNVFGKVGGNYGETRVSSNPLSGVAAGKARGWGVSYGIGAGYDFDRQNGIVLEYGRDTFRYPAIGRKSVDSVSVGYVYRF